MLFRIFSFFIIVGCSACRPSVLESALERAGENRIELERVLRHYSEEDKDSLKWEAARFLIENMPGHLSIGGDSIGPYYAALNAVFSNDTLRNWQDSLDKIHEYYKSGLRVQEDIKVIKSGFLIANIDRNSIHRQSGSRSHSRKSARARSRHRGSACRIFWAVIRKFFQYGKTTGKFIKQR